MMRLLPLILFLLISCDFSSRLQKEIIIAQNFVNDQNYVEAIKKYEEIIRLKPSPVVKTKVHYQLGELYSLYLGNYHQALYNFNMVLETSPIPKWQVNAQERIADIQFSFLEKHQDALDSYQKLYAYQPALKEKDFFGYRIGRSYYYLEQFEEAKKWFEKIIKDEKNDFALASLNDLGLCYFQEKNWEKAVHFWRQYIKREVKREKVIQARFMLANDYEMLEKLKIAYDIYYSILGEYPNTKVLKERLRSIYQRRIARKR